MSEFKITPDVRTDGGPASEKTLRDDFAGQIMAARMSNPKVYKVGGPNAVSVEKAAAVQALCAYIAADALLVQRTKQQTQ